MHKPILHLISPAAALAAVLSFAGPAFAHCDTMDGPVVKAARAALETGNVNEVLIWVKGDNEADIKAAFKKTLAVRKLNAAAKDLADHYFFEAVVRVHRQGEGAPYTGLKPAGANQDPAIAAADKSIETGDAGPVSALLADAVRTGLHEKYERAHSQRTFDKNSVEAGRAYVGAYVEYIHFVERLYSAARTSAHGNTAESGEAHGEAAH